MRRICNGIGMDEEGRLWEVPLDFSKGALLRDMADDLTLWMIREVQSGRSPEDVVAEVKRVIDDAMQGS